MSRDQTVTLGAESFTFDMEQVSGLDAWAFVAFTGSDLVDVLAAIKRTSEAGEPLAFHLAVVGKWLAARQAGLVLSFADVAGATFLPFRQDPPAAPVAAEPAPVAPVAPAAAMAGV